MCSRARWRYTEISRWAFIFLVRLCFAKQVQCKYSKLMSLFIQDRIQLPTLYLKKSPIVIRARIGSKIDEKKIQIWL